MRKESSPSSLLPLVAAGLTILLTLGALALVTIDRLASSSGRHIEDAPQTPLVLPIICGVLLLIAIGWSVWLIRQHGLRHTLSLIAIAISAILLVLTPLFAVQSFSNQRDLTVVSMTCDAEDLRFAGGAPTSSCTDQAVETIVLLQGVSSSDQWIPDSATGNLTREFTDLPGDKWDARLIVDGPLDTVAVAAVVGEGDEQTRIGNFRPYMDTDSNQLRWSAVVPVDTDVSTVRILFYLSQNPAVGSASIRFDVQECPGQPVRSFDASKCAPFVNAAGFVMEAPPAGPRTWRHPRVVLDGTSLVVSNLEARTYELEPDYATIEMYTQSTDVLIIPAAMPQIEENSITKPGDASFEITINEQSGEQLYTIYIFPSGPTYADASDTHQQ